MNPAPNPVSLSPLEVKRAWRIVTAAGSLATIYGVLCLTGAPRTKYLTELGATASHFGYIAAFGSIAVLFQIFSGVWGSHLRNRRMFFVVLGIGHRLLYIGVLAAPLLFIHSANLRLWWIIAILFLHDAIAQLTVPVWYSWMADLVPDQEVNRYWAVRTRRNTVTSIAASFGIVFIFWYFESNQQVILGFTLLAIVGLVAGVTDIALFLKVPEPAGERDMGTPLAQMLLRPLADKQFRPYILFTCVWMLAVSVGGPFFSLYMIQHLELSVGKVQLISAMSTLGVVVTSRFWGLMCDTYGQRPVLQLSLFGKALIPLSLLITPAIPAIAIPWLAIAFFIDGLTLCSLMLATQGFLLKGTPRRSRSMYIAAINFIGGVVAAVGSAISGEVIERLSHHSLDLWVYSLNGFHLMFGISFLLRITSSFFAARIHEPTAVDTRDVLRQLSDLSAFRTARIIHRLSDTTDEKKRLALVRWLGMKQSPLAIKELIRTLQDESRPVRRAAADALGKIGAAEAAEPLVRVLCGPDSELQSPAARALGRIGGYDSLKGLLANLRNLSPEALGETAEALARIGDSAAILPLICIYDEIEDRPIRRRIAQALCDLCQTDSVEEVAALFQGPIETARNL